MANTRQIVLQGGGGLAGIQIHRSSGVQHAVAALQGSTHRRRVLHIGLHHIVCGQTQFGKMRPQRSRMACQKAHLMACAQQGGGTV